MAQRPAALAMPFGHGAEEYSSFREFFLTRSILRRAMLCYAVLTGSSGSETPCAPSAFLHLSPSSVSLHLHGGVCVEPCDPLLFFLPATSLFPSFIMVLSAPADFRFVSFPLLRTAKGENPWQDRGYGLGISWNYFSQLFASYTKAWVWRQHNLS